MVEKYAEEQCKPSFMTRSHIINITPLFFGYLMVRDNDCGKLARAAILEGTLRMSHRFFASTTAALTASVMLCAQTPASGQAAPAATKAVKTTAGTNKAWTPAHTPDGHADLQGVWTNSTETPLERPKGLGAKEFYTEAELADLVKKDQNRFALNKEEGRPTEPGTNADVHYDYSQYGLDRGQAKLAWNRRTSLIVGEKGTVPPMLPEARRRNAEIAAKNRGHELDGPENLSLSARCIVDAQESVPMLSGGYNNNLQIVQGAEVVAIMNEMNHSVRVVPIDGRPHLPADVHQFRGDSIGHWEGNTLVVDSTNFTARNPFHGPGDRLHVVGIFTRFDADTIPYRFT